MIGVMATFSVLEVKESTHRNYFHGHILPLFILKWILAQIEVEQSIFLHKKFIQIKHF